MQKYGEGQVLPEEDDQQKTATKEWGEDDAEELRQENEEADA